MHDLLPILFFSHVTVVYDLFSALVIARFRRFSLEFQINVQSSKLFRIDSYGAQILSSFCSQLSSYNWKLFGGAYLVFLTML